MVLADVVNTSPAKTSKFGRASPVMSLKFSLDRLSLLSPSNSAEHAYLAPEAESQNAEEETECFNGFFLGEEEEVDKELLSQRQEKSVEKSISNSSKEMTRIFVASSHLPGLEDSSDCTNGWSSDGQSSLQVTRQLGNFGLDSRSPLVWAEGGSQAIDMPSSEKGSSQSPKMRKRRLKKLASVRESLLAEAWERKRDQMLHEELFNGKEKRKQEELGSSLSNSGRSASNSGNSPDSQTRTKSRNRSLTDDDFEELRGCIDLGFRFDENCSTDLCDTLPALEVYCAVTQKLHDSPRCMSPVSQKIQSPSRCSSPCSSPAWKVASPGDNPEDVKGRLRHWAQAVACSAKLCY